METERIAALERLVEEKDAEKLLLWLALRQVLDALGALSNWTELRQHGIREARAKQIVSLAKGGEVQR